MELIIKESDCKMCNGLLVAEYEDAGICFNSQCNKDLKQGQKCEVTDCQKIKCVSLCPDCSTFMLN
jgi:hypothetical protein